MQKPKGDATPLVVMIFNMLQTPVGKTLKIYVIGVKGWVCVNLMRFK